MASEQNQKQSELQQGEWWRDAVIYQVYPRSWADADGDGVGDLPGITGRLQHLVDLGVDAIWLSPFYTSPQNDAGYDVADYRDVDPLFGTLPDADAMIARAHELGLRVIVDLVPNHSSSQHPWFQAALASPRGSRERARYLFRDGKGPGGEEPPNNWPSVFGGPAWERVDDGQWYLHLFDASQPDFDWTNPEVRAEMESVLRFWLGRGVDGFRVDVAHGLVKEAGLPDQDLSLDPQKAETREFPMWDRDGVHEIYRSWRALLDEYDGERILCAEAWVTPNERLARYVRPDEMHQTFNFDFLLTPWLAPLQRAAIDRSLESTGAVGAPATWVLSNHDVPRHTTRLGYPPAATVSIAGIGADDPQPDAELGLRRARAATTLMLALPGSAYLYQGEELGLPDATRLPDEARQDPTYERSGHRERGRDGCRVPVPWHSGAPSYGFGPGEASWLPQPEEYGDLAPDRQTGDPGSTLELYRTLLRLRRERGLGRSTLAWNDETDEDLLSLTLTTAAGATTVLVNFGLDPVPLPAGAELLVASGPLDPDGLPTDTAIWLHSSPNQS